jgi:hypothetical protein
MMTDVMVLVAAADDYVTGRLGSEALPMVASEALARAVDSPALRELAGLGRRDSREAADLLALAMDELGHPLRTALEVLWGGLGGRRGPAGRRVERPGGDRSIATALCAAGISTNAASVGRLPPFELLAFEYDEDDAADPTSPTAAEIREAARELLDRPGGRMVPRRNTVDPDSGRPLARGPRQATAVAAPVARRR